MADPVRVGRLAVIGVFYRRPLLIPRIAAALRAQTRPPDETLLVCEEQADLEALVAETWPGRVVYLKMHIPPGEIPSSVCINAALDLTRADYIAYLTDDSLPHPDKYAEMVAALDAGAQAVYCSQRYGKVGSHAEWLGQIDNPPSIRHASEPSEDPFCRVDHTQVAHVRTEDRWPLSMGEIKWSDGAFFRDLVKRLGPLQPIPGALDHTLQMPDGVSART